MSHYRPWQLLVDLSHGGLDQENDAAVTTVLDFTLGVSAQIDFGKGPERADQYTGEVQKNWFLVMVLSWSRYMYAGLVVDQASRPGLAAIAGYSKTLTVSASCMVDNLKAAIIHAYYHDP